MSKPAKSGEPTTMPVELPEEIAQGGPNPDIAAAARMRKLLHEVEWSGPTVQLPTHRRVGTCPICGQHQPHAAGCRLKAEIG